MDYSELLQHESMEHLAKVLGCVYDPQWRKKYPRAKWGQTIQMLDMCFPVQSLDRGLEAFGHILYLLTVVVEADPKQSYTANDINWLTAQVDSCRTQSELGALLNLLRVRATTKT